MIFLELCWTLLLFFWWRPRLRIEVIEESSLIELKVSIFSLSFSGASSSSILMEESPMKVTFFWDLWCKWCYSCPFSPQIPAFCLFFHGSFHVLLLVVARSIARSRFTREINLVNHTLLMTVDTIHDHAVVSGSKKSDYPLNYNENFFPWIISGLVSLWILLSIGWFSLFCGVFRAFLFISGISYY